MSPLTATLGGLSLLTLLALVFASTALCLVRTAAKAARKEQAGDNDLASALQTLRSDLESLASEIRETQPAPALFGAPPRNGLNLAKRSQALRLNRHGSSAAQIASALEIPLQEVELLLKVDRIVIGNL